jgi:nucleoside-triphosphatase
MALSGVWLVTGPTGVGKSTVVSKVILKLKSAGVIVGGCTTSEIRSKGARTGFEVTDLTSGAKGELASVDAHYGPKVGRYRVNLGDLAKVGARGLEAASAASEVIVIDEVGPMELVSPEFRRAVEMCRRSGRPLLAVVHERLEDDIILELRREATHIFELTPENRSEAVDEIATAVLAAAGGPKV